MNHTWVGWPYYEANTGRYNLDDLMQIQKYDLLDERRLHDRIIGYNDSLSERCSLLRGTDGRTVQPYLKPNQPNIWIFLEDIQRSFHAQYASEDKIGRFDTFRFELDNEDFLPPIENKNTSCYCSRPFWDPQHTDLDCASYGGAWLIDHDYLGIPILISNPHFWLGEKFINNDQTGVTLVDGYFLDGNLPENDFKTWVSYDQLMGLPILGNGRYQLNLAINRDTNYNIYENMVQQTQVLPLLWVNETFDIRRYENLEYNLWLMGYLGLQLYSILFGVLLGGCLAILAYFSYQKKIWTKLTCCQLRVDTNKNTYKNMHE